VKSIVWTEDAVAGPVAAEAIEACSLTRYRQGSLNFRAGRIESNLANALRG
jgi:hypothetical protein